jgi:hypothetical protein
MAQDHLLEVIECTNPVEAVCARVEPRSGTDYSRNGASDWHSRQMAFAPLVQNLATCRGGIFL